MSSPTRLTGRQLLRRFARDRGDSELQRALATRAVESLPHDLEGVAVLDLGSGPGHASRELLARGARPVAVDLSLAEILETPLPQVDALVSDARRLPFVDEAFDGVFCSNVLEHTPDPSGVIAEIERVLRPGGWCYLSWTNWLSPWGGHAIAPLHYLGADRGLRAYRRLFGEPAGKNLPYAGVWPTYIGTILRRIGALPRLRIDRVEPRYYPRLRVIMRVPGLREVAAWNCAIRMTKLPDDR